MEYDPPRRIPETLQSVSLGENSPVAFLGILGYVMKKEEVKRLSLPVLTRLLLELEMQVEHLCSIS
jgi:hypothetical protein